MVVHSCSTVCLYIWQESLANANVKRATAVHVMYEGRYRRNLSSVKNGTLEANVIVTILYASAIMLF